MAKMGRPKINIDKKIFENLCAIQCNEIEICGCFDCCEDTLNKWCKENYRNENGKPMTFSEVFAEKRQQGRASLRRSQWRLAEKNATMAIFLGKQFLGQRDNMDITVGDSGALALEELEKMVKQDDSETSGGVADT